MSGQESKSNNASLDDLERILNAPFSYTEKELAEARAALERIRAYKPVPAEEWAERLAKDLAKFTD
ncbi:hypothetical protein FJY93_00500 [Candidatus Kaiserbacteria bacterium]|nr:hypothetical protein [Candidatus Kaiserbacteria bacterium]